MQLITTSNLLLLQDKDKNKHIHKTDKTFRLQGSFCDLLHEGKTQEGGLAIFCQSTCVLHDLIYFSTYVIGYTLCDNHKEKSWMDETDWYQGKMKELEVFSFAN